MTYFANPNEIREMIIATDEEINEFKELLASKIDLCASCISRLEEHQADYDLIVEAARSTTARIAELSHYASQLSELLEYDENYSSNKHQLLMEVYEELESVKTDRFEAMEEADSINEYIESLRTKIAIHSERIHELEDNIDNCLKEKHEMETALINAKAYYVD